MLAQGMSENCQAPRPSFFLAIATNNSINGTVGLCVSRL